MTLEQVAADFGVHAVTLSKWMRRADIDDGVKPGTTAQENAELRAARQRIKLLEQENEVLRRAAAYLSRANPSSTWRRKSPASVPLPGARAALRSVRPHPEARTDLAHLLRCHT